MYLHVVLVTHRISDHNRLAAPIWKQIVLREDRQSGTIAWAFSCPLVGSVSNGRQVLSVPSKIKGTKLTLAGIYRAIPET